MVTSQIIYFSLQKRSRIWGLAALGGHFYLIGGWLSYGLSSCAKVMKRYGKERKLGIRQRLD